MANSEIASALRSAGFGMAAGKATGARRP